VLLIFLVCRAKRSEPDCTLERLLVVLVLLRLVSLDLDLERARAKTQRGDLAPPPLHHGRLSQYALPGGLKSITFSSVP
jgi:hypothetical protein